MINTIRKYISQSLAPLPQMKVFIKRYYMVGSYCLARSNFFLKRVEPNLLKAYSITDKKYHCFFGYYDKTPWDSSNRYFLYLKVSFANRMPAPGEKAKICMLDLRTGTHKILAETLAWCWQQGCMLQWLGRKFDRFIIYNDFKGGKYVSVIYDILNDRKKIFPKPVYAVSKDGKQALTLNFSRLGYIRPGYGYVAVPFSDRNSLHPSSDGIWHLDLKRGRSTLLLSLEKLVHFQWKKEFEKAFHWVNHVEFNPSGNRFVFLHRWRFRQMSYTRMLTANSDGTDLYCLSDHGMVSHFTWKDDTHLLAWARQPIGDHYFIFEDKTKFKSIIGKNILDEDGHPSFSPDGRWILSDTYPNRERRRTLILFDTKTSQRFDIGRYFAPFRFEGPIRCDLHPRWSRDGTALCFDSIHEGKRQVYVVNDLSVVMDS
jgi:hypothetical protein